MFIHPLEWVHHYLVVTTYVRQRQIKVAFEIFTGDVRVGDYLLPGDPFARFVLETRLKEGDPLQRNLDGLWYLKYAFF
jgi:hypothetical protein